MARRLPNLDDFDAVTFDINGTVLNWEPEIDSFFRRWAERHGIAADSTTLLQAYDRLRRPIQDRRPALRYGEVLRQTFDAVAAAFGGPADSDLRQDFGETAAHHKPFADSDAALVALKARGLRLGALSNNDEAALAKACGQLSVAFDVVVTGERVGAYKPDPAHFMAALSDLLALGIPPDRVLHVAQSRRADIVPANRLGLTSVWVNRPGHLFGRAGDGAEAAQPDYEVSSLAELVDGAR